MTLSDFKCRNTNTGPKLQKLSDGGGLQLWIQPNGSRLWRLAYRFGGKQKLLALGVYPAVSLADARLAAESARTLLATGIDPSQDKKEKKAAEVPDTFRAIAEEHLDRLVKEGRAEATLSKTRWLLDFAYPVFGDLPIREINSATVLKALRQVEARGRYESARRLRSTIGTVFRYAIATVRAETDPTLALQGALIKPKVKPRPAVIEPEAVGALLRAIDSFEGQPSTVAALKLMALLFPRPGELRLAEWPEFNLREAVWNVPAGRMKMRRPHRVPLPRQAVVILKELREISTDTLLFP